MRVNDADNKISIIIIMVSILIITSGTGILNLVFAQNDSENSEDSETDLNNLTLTNSSENQVQVGSSDAELPQQQGPIPPATAEQPSEEPTIR